MSVIGWFECSVHVSDWFPDKILCGGWGDLCPVFQQRLLSFCHKGLLLPRHIGRTFALLGYRRADAGLGGEEFPPGKSGDGRTGQGGSYR